MKFYHLLAFFLGFTITTFAQDHLLITEIVVTPTGGEYIEIHNPTAAAIDLSNYYVTDATSLSNGNYYYNIVTGSNAGGGSSGDFHARFPDAASIDPGQFQTISMSLSGFRDTYAGADPTYALWDTSSSGLPVMREAFSGSINQQGGFTNSGEVAVLYVWDGSSDLVQDVDYLVWGDKEEGVDKTGIAIDGPDPDSDASTYLDDTAISAQIAASSGTPHAIGSSLQRATLSEINETSAGGNGITGNDETSEDLATAYTSGSPTPNSGPPPSDAPIISNINRSPVSPSSSDIVTITADVTDDVALSTVFLHSSIDGGAFDSTAMVLQSGDSYSGEIAAQAANTVVEYFVRATDSDNLTTSSTTDSYTVSAPPMLVTIADIQANPAAFTNVIVEGIITLGAGITTSNFTNAYVQDSSGRGIQIFQSGAIDPDLVRGNQVRVTGRVDEFGGVTEIVDYTVQVLSTGNPEPAPLQISTSAAMSNVSLEGTYVEVTGQISEVAGGIGGGTNITVNDGSGAATVRVWDDTGIDLTALSAGNDATLRGIFGIFNDAGQLLPGYQDQIVLPGQQPGDGSGIATISPDSLGQSQATSLTLTITGQDTFVLESVSVTVPDSWTWGGNVSLSGSGNSGASATVNGSEITVSGAAISASAQGIFTLEGLTSPGNDVTETFRVRTATAGGTLLPIASSPTVITGTGGAATTSIADIQANPGAFTTVTVEGIVTLGAGRTTSTFTSAYVQDNSGRGINVFMSGSIDPDYVRGNLVRVTGTIDEFNGVTEIVSYTTQVLSTGNPLPAPLILSTSAANSDISLEGTYIETVGRITDLAGGIGGGTNITLDDGSGGATVRVWDATGISLAGFGVGDTLAVRGIFGIFSDAGQIVPGYQDEILAPLPGDGSGTATITPDSVGLFQSVNASLAIAGGSATITTMTVTIPSGWTWSGSSSDVTLSGSGFSAASVITDGNFVRIESAAINSSSGGTIDINGLTSPADNAISVFAVKTATDGGILSNIASSPRVTVGAGQLFTPIADIQANPAAFTNVVVKAIVTLGAGVTRTDFTSGFVQDESGRGINVFGSGIDGAIARGNEVILRGSIDEFNGVTEIVNYTAEVVSIGNTIPAALILTTAELNSQIQLEGTYVQTGGEVTDIATGLGGGTNVTVDDGSGEATVRVWDITGLDLRGFTIGDTIAVRGTYGIFDNAGQLVPGYQDEIDVLSTPDLAGKGFASISPFNVPSDSGNISANLRLWSNASDTVRRVEITIPYDWGWAEEFALSGPGFADASAEIVQVFDERHLRISGGVITGSDSGYVTLNGLSSASDSVFSYFWVQTGGEEGTLGYLGDNPRVIVGSNPIYQLRDVQTYSPQFSQSITVGGVVTIASGLIRDDRTSAYFQDASGFGLNISEAGSPDPRYQQGILLRLTGSVSEFGGTTQIDPTSVSILDSAQQIPQPLELTTGEAFSPRWDGTLVRVRGVVTDLFTTSPASDPTPDYNLVVNDGTGGITLRIWGTTGIDVSEFHEGDAVIATGVGNVFISQGVPEYQLLPAYQENIVLDPNYQPSLATVSLTVPASPFVPDRGEKITIRYDAGSIGNLLNLRIFDLGGRLVATLVQQESAQLIQNVLEWNGRDKFRELLPIGTYICHLQVIESGSGKKKDKMAPIVIGTVLK